MYCFIIRLHVKNNTPIDHPKSQWKNKEEKVDTFRLFFDILVLSCSWDVIRFILSEISFCSFILLNFCSYN